MYDNVKIPFSLLGQIIYILDNASIYYCDEPFKREFYDVLSMLKRKKASLDLRDAFSSIVSAKDENARCLAMTRYLQKKREMEAGF